MKRGGNVILVTGGSGSGKSEYAENRIKEKDKKIYIATMKPFGREAWMRIERHQKLRASKGFRDVECFEDFCTFIENTKESYQDSAVLLECISNLVANELYHEDGFMNEPEEIRAHVIRAIRELMNVSAHLVIVTNEVNSDINGYSEETKVYQNLLGIINQDLADLADEVVEVVYGIPVKIK